MMRPLMLRRSSGGVVSAEWFQRLVGVTLIGDLGLGVLLSGETSQWNVETERVICERLAHRASRFLMIPLARSKSPNRYLVFNTFGTGDDA